jgi:hypothetical protein
MKESVLNNILALGRQQLRLRKEAGQSSNLERPWRSTGERREK